jgi:tetratricopeptide (TPR) repeat protein
MRARVYVLVLAVALAASVTSLRNGFVYDDVPVVVQNRALHTLDSLPVLLTGAYWPRDFRDRIFRPATLASFAVDWAVGGGRPLVFHATNVLLHLAVVALVLGLCASVLGRGAVVAALWFAVHPVHVEVFANAVGRSELLAALGYLGATLAYVAEGRAARQAPGGARRALWAVLVLSAAALAFGAKEHALSLPAALLLADVWTASRDGEPFGTAFRRHAILWLGVVALAAGYLAVRTHVLGTTFGGGTAGEGLGGLNALQRAVAILPLVLVWARLLAFPLHLSADYAPAQFVPETAIGASHVAALAVLLAVLAGAWRARRWSPGLLFGVAWFAVTAAIGSNLLVPTGVLFAERLLYLPSVGAAIAVGALWEPLSAHRAVWPLTTAVLALLAARTLERIPVWRTQERFFATIMRDAPASYRTHWQLGDRAFERGDARAGGRELLRAVRIYPYDAELLENIGRRYLSAGIDRPADRFLTAAYRLDSTRSAAAAQAVVARLRAGAVDSAVALAREAARRFPSDEAVTLVAITAFERAGDTLRVLALARQLTHVDPRRAAYQVIAGEAARRLGLCAEATARLARALALAADERARAEIRRRQTALGTCGARG